MTNDGDGSRARVAQLILAGELVAAVAHDLRHPLTAIEMNISAVERLLKMRADPPVTPQGSATAQEVGAALQDTLAEVQRMREALQVFEDLARRRDPVFAPVDVVALVHEAVRLIASELSARHVSVDIIAGANVPAILADATLVRQALLELLIDAMDGTIASDRPRGPVSITIRAADARGVEVVVSHYGAWDESAVHPEWALALARLVSDTHGAALEVDGDPVAGINVSILFPYA